MNSERARKLKLWFLRQLPMWEYRCPRCNSKIDKHSTCCSCGESFSKPLRVPPHLTRPELEKYVHEHIMPRLTRSEQEYLAHFFTLIFEDGFESGDLDGGGWTTTVSSGETVTVGTDHPHHGIYAARCYSNGGANHYARLNKTFDSTYVTLYSRVYIYFHTWRTDGDLYVLDHYNTTNAAPISRIEITGATETNKSWKVSWHDTSEMWSSGYDAPVHLDTWYCVELMTIVDATNGETQFWLDGTSQRHVTGITNNVHGNNIDRIRTGIVNSGPITTTTAYEVWVDCVRCEDVGPIGSLHGGTPKNMSSSFTLGWPSASKNLSSSAKILNANSKNLSSKFQIVIFSNDYRQISEGFIVYPKWKNQSVSITISVGGVLPGSVDYSNNITVLNKSSKSLSGSLSITNVGSKDHQHRFFVSFEEEFESDFSRWDQMSGAQIDATIAHYGAKSAYVAPYPAYVRKNLYGNNAHVRIYYRTSTLPTTSGWANLVEWKDADGTTQSYFGIWNDGGTRKYYYNVVGTQVTYSETPDLNTWHGIEVEFDGATGVHRIWRNGALIITVSQSTMVVLGSVVLGYLGGSGWTDSAVNIDSVKLDANFVGLMAEKMLSSSVRIRLKGAANLSSSVKLRQDDQDLSSSIYAAIPTIYPCWLGYAYLGHFYLGYVWGQYGTGQANLSCKFGTSLVPWGAKDLSSSFRILSADLSSNFNVPSPFIGSSKDASSSLFIQIIIITGYKGWHIQIH